MSYSPGIPTEQYSFEYFVREQEKIREALENIERIIFTEFNVAISKPRHGLVVFADGVNWNPGDGRGLYLYDGDDSYWYKLNMIKVIFVQPTTGTIQFTKETPTVS